MRGHQRRIDAPGRGIGLSMNPTCPISFMTKAFTGCASYDDVAREGRTRRGKRITDDLGRRAVGSWRRG